jgi:hypothetical protein
MLLAVQTEQGQLLTHPLEDGSHRSPTMSSASNQIDPTLDNNQNHNENLFNYLINSPGQTGQRALQWTLAHDEVRDCELVVSASGCTSQSTRLYMN